MTTENANQTTDNKNKGSVRQREQQKQSQVIMRIQCPASTTGAFGCILPAAVSSLAEETLSLSTKLLQGCCCTCKCNNLLDVLSRNTHLINVYSVFPDAHSNMTASASLSATVVGGVMKTEKIDVLEFCKFLQTHASSGMAAKIYRARFRNSSLSTRDVFMKEVCAIHQLQKAIGFSNLLAYTTYRLYNNAFAFYFEPKVETELRICIQHKPNYEDVFVDRVFFVLQEGCAFSLGKLISSKPIDHPPCLSSTLIDTNKQNTRCYMKNDQYLHHDHGTHNNETAAMVLPRSDLERMDVDLSTMLRIMHSAGMVHKDIKPDNIVYCPYSQIKFKLIDFAFSTNTDQCMGDMAGTKSYMSPYFIAVWCKTHNMKNPYLDLPKSTYMQYADKKIRGLYKILLKTHLLSLRRCNTFHDFGFIAKKNDEFAYALTLLDIYAVTHHKLLLMKALSLAACPTNMFG